MFTLFVIIIYLAFMSLGLPDSLLGSAWPVLHAAVGADYSSMGIITMIIASSTIVSSVFSNFLTNKLGTGLLTACSVLLTAVALVGFSFCKTFWQLCVWAVPYGLGAGAIDAALNNYVALHLTSRHMNWLHAFWGVGASISPYVMGGCLTGGLGWEKGYLIVGIVQSVLAAVVFASLPMWKKYKKLPNEQVELRPVKTKDALKVRGVWLAFIAFFCYCAMEMTAMQWASSYLFIYKNVSENLAATFATLFYSGMMVGRFVCGTFSNKVSDKNLIRFGTLVVAVGITLLALPLSTNVTALAGFVVMGLGCAPIYPAIIHSTPNNFGKENSQALVGIQMAFAYTGSTFMPPVFGLILRHGAWVMPAFLAGFAILTFVLSETVNKVVSANKAGEK